MGVMRLRVEAAVGSLLRRVLRPLLCVLWASIFSPVQEVCKLPNQADYDENSLSSAWR